MRVLVTGAGGFLGRAVVDAARRHHDVVAMVRPSAKVNDTDNDTNVEWLRADLRQRGPWERSLTGIDAVIHLAAAASGDLPTQLAGTVFATGTLLDALDLGALRRFVHISSFSVYDYAAPGVGDLLDETSALEPDPDRRDAYTLTKLRQERLVRERCAAPGTSLVVLRPGMIFGPGKPWAYGAAMGTPAGDLIIAPRGQLRLTYVDNCAAAIVAALDAHEADGATLNIVDDELPTAWDFHAMCRDAGASVGRRLAVPWRIANTVGVASRLVDRVAFEGHAKVPEILALRRMEARWKPLRYTNGLARATLDWAPHVDLRDAIAATVADPTGEM